MTNGFLIEVIVDNENDGDSVDNLQTKKFPRNLICALYETLFIFWSAAIRQ